MHATIIMEGRLVTDPEIKSGKKPETPITVIFGAKAAPICGQHKIWKSGQRLFLQLHRKRVHRQSDAEGRHQEGPSDRDHR